MNICRTGISNISNIFIKNVLCPFVLPNRTTFIVKRKFPPPLSKENAERKRILKAKNFVYETVEDTDQREPSPLKIVLTTFVDGVGDVGDVISLIPEYAHSHFLLPQKAVYATPENVEKYAALKKNRPEITKFSSIHAGMTMKLMSKIVIPVFMNPEVSWSIGKNHIHLAFRLEEFFVPEDCIELPDSAIEGPNPTIEEKDFAVFVTINNTEKFPVRCRLFHIKPGYEHIKLSDEFYLDKNEPILPEQKDLLEKMPTPEIISDPSANISVVEKYKIQYIK